MADRLTLHNELLKFFPNVYFQPPANITMKHPCIVYGKTGKTRRFASDAIYSSLDGYRITVIETNPDSRVADDIENAFDYCAIDQYYTSDGLNHVTLSLYY